MTKRKRDETNPEIGPSQDDFSEPESGPASSGKKITVRREFGKVIVSVPVRFYRRNGRQMILAEGVEANSNSMETTPPNNALVNALSKGYLWQQQIEAGQFEGLEDVAQANGVDRSYVGRVLHFTRSRPTLLNQFSMVRPTLTSACSGAGRGFRFRGTSNRMRWPKIFEFWTLSIQILVMASSTLKIFSHHSVF